jgi:hypothetical protein
MHNRAPFQECHRFGGVAKRAAVARFHFDEDQRTAVARDDVNFSMPPAPAPGNYFIPAAFELRDGEILARFSQGDPSIGHAPPTKSNDWANL